MKSSGWSIDVSDEVDYSEVLQGPIPSVVYRQAHQSFASQANRACEARGRPDSQRWKPQILISYSIKTSATIRISELSMNWGRRLGYNKNFNLLSFNFCLYLHLQENCKKVADEYIECENMILVIDLLLHKEKVYRHLFYNMFTRETLNFEGLFWWLSFGFLLLDAYKIIVLSRIEENWKSSTSFASIVSCYGKLLMDAIFGNLMFICLLLLGTRVLPKASVVSLRSKDIVLAILVSSYFKIFLIATMIWEFPSSVFYISDIVILSSNTLALKAITESAMPKCFGVCLTAYAVKFLVIEMGNSGLLTSGGIDWA